MHINKHYLKKKQNVIFTLFFFTIFFLCLLPRFLYLCFSSFYNPFIILALNFQIPLLTHILGLNYFFYPVSSLYLDIFFFDSFSVLFLLNPSALPFQKFLLLCSRNAFLCRSHMNIYWSGVDLQATIISPRKCR